MDDVNAMLLMAQPNDLVAFGLYPAHTDGKDKSPLRWRVLEKTQDSLFLLSESILDCRPFHHHVTHLVAEEDQPLRWSNQISDITWEESDLRQWLNEVFYAEAFSPSEKQQILMTHCTDNGQDSPDTHDLVFLLNVAEVKQLTSAKDEPSKIMRKTIGTDFAKAKKSDGSQLYVYDKAVKENYLSVEGEDKGCSWWWLRSQVKRSSVAYFVGKEGSIRNYGRIDLPYYGIRPAIRITLNLK